ncbi:MAG: hypothetical protein DRQ78_13655, partial [Epsilonproteobacteria bacterium]
MSLEETLEYFSILGGLEEEVELDYFSDVFSMVKSHFVKDFSKFQSLISPSFLLESPYQNILIALARGDGKLYSSLRKAKIAESLGEGLIQELIDLNILKVERSREAPLRTHPKHKLKKEQRNYRIQDKIRFVQPFLRFWFAFVSYYAKDLAQGEGDAFLANFEQHYERLRSLVYEQLCDAILIEYYKEKSPILSSGSYWNIYSEFDIL